LEKTPLGWQGTFCRKRPFSTFGLFWTWSFWGSILGGQKRAVFNVFFESRKKAIFGHFVRKNGHFRVNREKVTENEGFFDQKNSPF
jgi:hypothetical protein